MVTAHSLEGVINISNTFVGVMVVLTSSATVISGGSGSDAVIETSRMVVTVMDMTSGGGRMSLTTA